MTLLFNRKINIKAYKRQIGNKIVRVGPSSRKASVLRIREALKDAAKSKVEVGYVVSKSGRISKKVTNNSVDSVAYKFNDKLLPKKSPASATIHNHPNIYPTLTTSPPSSADIKNTISRGNYGYVVSSGDGSQFRYSRGKAWDNASLAMQHHLNRTVAKKLGTLDASLSLNTKYHPNLKFLIRDRFYQRLNQEGLIRYRVRPSDKLKEKRDKVRADADQYIDSILK